MTIVGNSNDADYQDMVAGDDLILACEVSRSHAPVQWYCNDRLLTNDSRTCIESYGTLRKIIISHVQPSDSGKYVCDAVDDKMISTVRIQGEYSQGYLQRYDYQCDNKITSNLALFLFPSKSPRLRL